MKTMTSMVVALLCLLVLMAASPVRGVNHVVGDSAGWSQAANLTAWATGRTFTVGDSLEFKYSSAHGVQLASKENYHKCDTSYPMVTVHGSQTFVNLNQAGPMYFICPTPGHCQAGIKLAVNVVPAGNGGVPTNGAHDGVATGKLNACLVLGFSLVAGVLVVVSG